MYSRLIDKTTGLRCDQSIVLTGPTIRQHYPTPLRRVKFRDAENTDLVFLTNDFSLPALAVAQLYRCRWQVETGIGYSKVVAAPNTWPAQNRRTFEARDCDQTGNRLAYHAAMTWLGRECPGLPAQLLFSAIELEVLTAHALKRR